MIAWIGIGILVLLAACTGCTRSSVEAGGKRVIVLATILSEFGIGPVSLPASRSMF